MVYFSETLQIISLEHQLLRRFCEWIGFNVPLTLLLQGFKYLYVTPSDFKKVRVILKIFLAAGISHWNYCAPIFRQSAFFRCSACLVASFVSCFFQLSASNSMHAELIEDDGESRYKVTDIIGEWIVTLHSPGVSCSFVHDLKFSLVLLIV